MSEVFGPLIELIKEFWESILPFIIVSEYEFGVKLRFGKFKERVDCGLVWKIPFVDNVILTHNTITTLNLQSQSLTTKDGKDVVISGIVKYKVSNPKTFLLEVNDAVDAINDITQGKIKEIVIDKNWDEVRTMNDKVIKELVDQETKAWGIKIYYITITDLALIRTIRLIQQ
jgi:regulator of protease activity HflC (stomatin/prohibitin superfamily)